MDKSRVVIVDDEKDIVTLISDFLEMGNFQIVGLGYDGNKALSLFETQKPDVIIMDYNLPLRSGLDVLEKIRKSQFHPIVIIISSDNSIRSDTRLLRLQPDAVILKPFDMMKLLEMMEDLISNKLILTKNSNNGDSDSL